MSHKKDNAADITLKRHVGGMVSKDGLGKPSSNEEEFFKKRDMEIIAKIKKDKGHPSLTMGIPISAAKDIANTYGYDQIIIIGRKVGVGGREHCTTYGVDKKHCEVAAKAGDFLKYTIMGWLKEGKAQ